MPHPHEPGYGYWKMPRWPTVQQATESNRAHGPFTDLDLHRYTRLSCTAADVGGLVNVAQSGSERKAEAVMEGFIGGLSGRLALDTGFLPSHHHHCSTMGTYISRIQVTQLRIGKVVAVSTHDHPRPIAH